ncbi:MAG: aconitate hydratase AcnA [Syntrophobacteraceae bacterium]
MPEKNPFNALTFLPGTDNTISYYRLAALEEAGLGSLERLPFSIKVLLEALLRQVDGFAITIDDVARLAAWSPNEVAPVELPFKPARVLLQDFTGVPVVVDLAAMRSAMVRAGGDASRVNPVIPVDLVIDHSVQVDQFGSKSALFNNARLEFERNRERYEFLKWGQNALSNFRVVPPATGIVHQVNLEYLSRVVQIRFHNGRPSAYPDTLVGTDSHTTMINGLGILGWGVGGIEAEAVMLGQPLYMLTPQVVGFRLTGELADHCTATDLVLTVTQMLRQKGVVDKFVEFFGPGVDTLSLPDRATIANMAPEYGATMGFFPVDRETLRYLRASNRPSLAETVERYCRAQGLFRSEDSSEPVFSDVVELDMRSVVPCVAGPRRPQDRLGLDEVAESLTRTFPSAYQTVRYGIDNGSVVIAAITSCTNTSNPGVMVSAGILARNAVERGLRVKPWVKTSLAPGSTVVTRYLDEAGLTQALETLGFYTVGYGCTTCIGNSGPIPEPVAAVIRERDLTVAAVLSGNRNFEGRIHPLVRANYLASPPLVVAYALAGTVNIDFARDPLGADSSGRPVYLKDIWPDKEEVQLEVSRSLHPAMFREQYDNLFISNFMWNGVPIPEGETFRFDPESTYIKEPPYFDELTPDPQPKGDIRGARVLALFGDSVTTDHISPAGSIASGSPAGRYLLERSVPEAEFNQYGTRRGNHEVMVRGTFANIRIRNQLVPGTEGGYTLHQPSGEKLPIYEAAMRYVAESVPTIVLAGKEYGTGSSRDWAAKGPALQGVKAVIAESFERIHRSNLVGMGILPLQFLPGHNVDALGLTGLETFDIVGIEGAKMQPKQTLTVRVTDATGGRKEFDVVSRIDTPVEIEYYRNGGILQTVLRQRLKEKDRSIPPVTP